MQDTDDLARNKHTVRALYEDAISGHRMATLPELIAPEFPGGPAGFEAVLASLLVAFPDIRYAITDLTAEGDRVAVRWTWTGTHQAAFRGFPASGNRVTDSGMAIYTLRDGLITGVALETDRLGFLQQLGVVAADGELGAAAAIDPRRAPNAVYLIDTFTVPGAARAEFDAAAKRNREFLHTLPGLRGDVVFVCKQGDAFDVATIAAWESPEAIARAKEEVAAYYHRIGFDMPAAMARWGVTLRRAICAAPAELQ